MSVANSRMKIFENRQLQLESKPNNQTAGSLVKPPEDEVKSFKVPLMAWTHHASSQLNPNRDQTFNILTNFSEPRISVNRDCEPNFSLEVSPNQLLHLA